MNAAPSQRSLPRSIGAVVAGFLTVAVLSTVTDLCLHAARVFPPEGQPMTESLWYLATVYRLFFTVAGGFVTAAIAPSRPTTHVVVLGCIGAVMALLGVIATWDKGPAFGPKWYPISLVVTAIPCTWLGGRLRARPAETA
jgi:hypothetical protein